MERTEAHGWLEGDWAGVADGEEAYVGWMMVDVSTDGRGGEMCSCRSACGGRGCS
jgi:hypothetical protein